MSLYERIIHRVKEIASPPLDMARHFEGGASSFRTFVERLEADAERGEEGY